jgi:hypothetical protein
MVSRDRSRVGHFRSAAGEQANLAAYRDVMNLLPTPRLTLDLETSLGHVRLYEFGAASADRAAMPVVLLPGCTSGVPMWASNLPGLAAARITYALDALGDAGRSVQIQPIHDATDRRLAGPGVATDLSPRLRRVDCEELAAAGVAGCQGVLDELPGVGERGHLSVNPSFDLLESPALRRTGCSAALVHGERIDHFVDRQAQFLELASQPDSVEVALYERPVAAGGAGRRSQDTATFVEPDRVDRHADNISEFADLHGVIGHRYTPSA